MWLDVALSQLDQLTMKQNTSAFGIKCWRMCGGDCEARRNLDVAYNIDDCSAEVVNKSLAAAGVIKLTPVVCHEN